ncbi:ComEC/Rec2 family competence protein [Collimonas sp. OK607]|uniref:ComEC/Rec2 family competence protein n=1 Tax=Collimonas sp. OK607 TaxID=1798194 RepID=UPI00352A8A9A
MQTRASLPDVWLLCGLLLLAILPAVTARKIGHPCLKSAVNMLAGALFGITWAALLAQYYLQHELPSAWEGRDISVIGTVDSLPSYFESGARFTFAVEKVLDQDGVSPIVPKRLALAWYQTAGQPLPVQVQPGARWQLTVRLKRPHGNANPPFSTMKHGCWSAICAPPATCVPIRSWR